MGSRLCRDGHCAGRGGRPTTAACARRWLRRYWLFPSTRFVTLVSSTEFSNGTVGLHYRRHR